jgi:hypothetical protein
MRHFRNPCLCVLALVLARPCLAQDPNVATNAPQDQPAAWDTVAWKRAETAMAPYVAKARETWPAVRQRYIAGLPVRQSLFVTAHLRDDRGRREQTFIAVDSLARDSIFGRIWNEIHLVRGFQFKQPYGFAETELIDWLIAKPDGTEEGNIVGVFLDSYRP